VLKEVKVKEKEDNIFYKYKYNLYLYLMGIYSSGKIFGIRIYNFIDDFTNILFEKTYDGIMSEEEKKEAYLFYTELNKNEIHFHYYTECSSTYDTGVFMTWFPISLDSFLENFCVK